MPGKRTARRPPPQRIPEPRPGFVAVGWVQAPRGVRGELKVSPMTDFRQRFQPGATLRAGETSYTVRRSRAHHAALLLELEGVETREEAEALRGCLLEVPEEDLAPLEEGQYFRFEIVGMAVFDTDGRPLGRIEDVLETGANDVYIVRNPDGDLLIPAIDTVVKEVDVPRRRMVVHLIAGLERRPHTPPRRR